MPTFNLRHLAGECVKRARELLARGDEPSARHACLELRMAIEYITYSSFQKYIDDVSDEALKKWTPKQVLSEMLDIDPSADKSTVLAVGIEHEFGVPPPAAEMQSLGEDRRFSMSWANKHHNALGSFLHAPSLHQLGSGKVPTAAAIAAKAEEIATECERILSSLVFDTRLALLASFECTECGKPVKRAIRGVAPNRTVECLQCGAKFHCRDGEGDAIILTLQRVSYTCGVCAAPNTCGVHRVVDGAELICANCGARPTVRQGMQLVYPPNPAGTGSDNSAPSAAETETIQQRAYERYLQRGGADGYDLEDWYEAEKEVRRRA